jgi:hypothetical protein
MSCPFKRDVRYLSKQALIRAAPMSAFGGNADINQKSRSYRGTDSCMINLPAKSTPSWRALAVSLSQCLPTSATNFPNDAVLCREMNF